jgi:hypothetical protein
MAARSRHAKPRSRASKIGPLAAAAAALAGVAAAFLLLQGGAAGAGPRQLASAPAAPPGSGAARADTLMITAIHRASAAVQARADAGRARDAARRRHLAEHAAQQRSPAPTQGSSPPAGGAGAYQFQLSTWERYGGAASEYGVAGPAYQDQIFDNAIAAGGASNWTAYDGC